MGNIPLDKIITALAALVGSIVSLITALNGAAALRRHKVDMAEKKDKTGKLDKSYRVKKVKWIGFVAIGALGVVLIGGAYFYDDIFGTWKGEYQWQWAGENWLGYVEIDDHEGETVAKIQVNKVFKKKETLIKGPHVLTSSEKGSVSHNRRGLKLTLPVTRSILDENNQVIRQERGILEAGLVPVKAYAGIVKYKFGQDTFVCPTGDMILVKYPGIRF